MLQRIGKHIMMWVVAICSIYSLTSCSNDEDGLSSNANIVGEWMKTREIHSEKEGNASSNYDEDVRDQVEVWKFQDNGDLLIYRQHELFWKRKWSFKGNKLVLGPWNEAWNEDEEQYYIEDVYNVTISSGKMILKYSEKDSEGSLYDELQFVNCNTLKDIKPEIIGRWYMTEERYTPDDWNSSDLSEYGIVWDIMSDGTIDIYVNETDLDGTRRWECLGNYLTLLEDDDYFQSTYEVKLSEGKMSLKEYYDYDNKDRSIEYKFVRSKDDIHPGIPDSDPDSDNDSDSVEGKWAISKIITQRYTFIPELQNAYNDEEVKYGNGEYWEFTSTKVTVHDPSDLMNGKPINYTFNKATNELSISGWVTYNVTQLTSRQMTLEWDTNDGQFGERNIMEFTKM